MLITAGAAIDATHVTVVVRVGPGPGKASLKIERVMLHMTRQPNVLVWDTLRLAFRKAGLGEPLGAWQEFATAVSTVARMTDIVEARLVRQREEVA